METITFSREKTSFPQEVRRKVNQLFIEKNIGQKGNAVLYKKTSLFFALFFGFFVLPYVFNLGRSLHFWDGVALGIMTDILGFCVAHDAAHGSFFEKKFWNNLFSRTFELLGTSSFFWKVKHNVAHHTYTNIGGADDDINTGNLLRFSDKQKWRWWHRYQIVYIIPTYMLLQFYWVFFTDFKKLFKRRVASTEIPAMNLKEYTIFAVAKLVHFFLFWILPWIVFGFWEMLIVNVGMYATSGLIMAIVFQLAHVNRNSIFPEPDESGNIEEAWATEQMATTSNFAPKNLFATHILGGLNLQVIHHLFPLISHVHYPMVEPVVKETAEEYSLPYNEFKTFWSALWDHLKHIQNMSKKPAYV